MAEMPAGGNGGRLGKRTFCLFLFVGACCSCCGDFNAALLIVVYSLMSSVFNSFIENAGKKLWVSVVAVVVVRAVGGLCGWFCALVVCFRRFLCSCISSTYCVGSSHDGDATAVCFGPCFPCLFLCYHRASVLAR